MRLVLGDSSVRNVVVFRPFRKIIGRNVEIKRFGTFQPISNVMKRMRFFRLNERVDRLHDNIPPPRRVRGEGQHKHTTGPLTPFISDLSSDGFFITNVSIVWLQERYEQIPH